MLKKIIPLALLIATLFCVAPAYAKNTKAGFFDDEASLCVTNRSNTMVRVTTGIFANYHYLSPGTHLDIYPTFYTLFNVDFKYLAMDGMYYPIQNCYRGDLETDLTVLIQNSPYYPYYPYCINMW
ncbi:MAG: hypothetical protein HY939_04635 [Gammaproteobacteria bacterium]|nr:hypothetical protein [Gammaproteobacteria bacterium]